MGRFDWKGFHASYADHLKQLTVVENMFREAIDLMNISPLKEERLVGLKKNLAYGDFRISFVFKDIRSLEGYVSRREEMPALGDYLMLFETGRKIPIGDPIKTLPSINSLARSQGMESTLPRMAEEGLLEVSMYDEGQRIAVLWSDSYCTNEPDLALRIGRQIYGMQMKF